MDASNMVFHVVDPAKDSSTSFERAWYCRCVALLVSLLLFELAKKAFQETTPLKRFFAKHNRYSTSNLKWPQQVIREMNKMRVVPDLSSKRSPPPLIEDNLHDGKTGISCGDDNVCVDHTLW